MTLPLSDIGVVILLTLIIVGVFLSASRSRYLNHELSLMQVLWDCANLCLGRFPNASKDSDSQKEHPPSTPE